MVEKKPGNNRPVYIKKGSVNEGEICGGDGRSLAADTEKTGKLFIDPVTGGGGTTKYTAANIRNEPVRIFEAVYILFFSQYKPNCL